MSSGSGSAAILDLKAELLRKYNDAEKKNRTEKIDPFTVRKGGFRVEVRKPKERKLENVPPPDDGEEEALNESRRRLEEKARLYESKKAEVWTEDNEDSLIDFNRKRKLERKHLEEAAEDDSEDDDDDEWTTFEDALGRTRKCLKTDLPHYLSENRRLTESLRPSDSHQKPSTQSPLDDIPLPGAPPECPPGEAAASMTDPEKEERLKKWDEIEQQNQSKEHLHYRDVLFDEIREHGQAHFEFSRDETERAHQMKILDKLREDSIRAQRVAQEIKKTREQMQRERLNKIRLRKGLAPEPEKAPEPTPASPPPPAQPSLPPADPVARIRPWDEGKEVHGVPIRMPPRKDYYDERREERPAEFAPPQSYNNRYGKSSAPPKKETQDVSEFLRRIRDST